MGKVIKSYAVQPVEEMILAALVIASAIFLEEFRKDRFVETDAEEAPVVKFAQSAIFKQKQKIRVFFEIDAAMLKRFAEAGVAVFQNRSTVDKFVHCQGISGNIKMMC